MLGWVPKILYNKEGEHEEKDVTFNLLEAVNMELIGFIGLIQLLLCLFLLLDLAYTWWQPIKYLSNQHFMNHVFLVVAKVS